MNKITGINNNMWDSEIGVNSLEQLATIAIQRDWSHSVFKEGKRAASNFLYANYFVVDIDEGMTLLQADEIAKDYSCIIVLSRNHQKEKNGVVVDRFRIIFELQYPITSERQFKATFAEFKRLFPTLDTSASSNCAGLWYKASDLYRIYSGIKVQPALEEQVPTRAVVDFGSIKGVNKPSKQTISFMLSVNELDGKRWEPFRKAVIDLKQQGFLREQAEAFLTSVHSDWYNEEYSTKLKSIYDNVEPKYPARVGIGPSFEEAELERWSKDWIISNNLDCTFSGALSIGSTYYTFNDICRKMRIDRDRAGAKIHEDKIKDYLEEWISLARDAHLKKVVDRLIPYRGIEAEQELSKFVSALVVGATPVDLAVVKHFLWQVKQKMAGRQPTYHLMPVFYGPQGSGKTTAIFKLLSPLGELISSPNGFNFVKDYREIHIFKDHFVIFSDEMAQADRADVNLLKNLISSPHVESRVMKAHTRERFPNNATLVGATNRPLKDVIMDDTGARRFYQLSCPHRMDFAAINSIDYGLLWGAVKVDEPAPILSVLEEVSKTQEEQFRSKGPVELWMEEAGYVVDNEAGKDGTNTDKAYKLFKEHEGGHWTASSFGRALSRLGVKKYRERVAGGKAYLYGIKKEEGLGNEEF